MATLLTVDEVREHVETDLSDDALTRLIEDADAEIIDRLGALAAVTEDLAGEGLKRLPLNRKASAIVSVTLRVAETDYPLAANDYALVNNGRWLERRNGSTLPDLLWNGQVTIVYTPAEAANTAGRKRLLIDLVKLAADYDATSSSRVGDVSTTSNDYALERENLFAPFMRKNRRFII